MNGYIVMAIFNLDDIVVLVTKSKQAAIRKAASVATEPDTAWKFGLTNASDQSEFVCTRVYSVTSGDRFTQIWRSDKVTESHRPKKKA